MSHRWRPVALSLAIVSALAVCSAQQIFRSGVSLVLVDLRVIDNNSRSVPDLDVKDVEVLVDGQPRPIVGFDDHGEDPSLAPLRASAHGGGTATAAPQGSPSIQHPDSEFTPESMPRPPGRTIVLAVQSNTINIGDGPRVYKGADEFIDNLRPTDSVSVVMLPAGAVTHLGFTSSHESIKRRLQYAWTHTSGAEWVRAAGPTNCDAPAASVSSGSSYVLSQACRDAKQAAAAGLEEVERVRAIARDLNDLFDALGGVEGPKDLVLVTTGFDAPIGEIGFLPEIVRAASRARVRVHTLQIGDLADMISPESRMSGRAEGPSMLSPTPDQMHFASSMLHLATATGGIAMTPMTGGIFFKRLERELAGGYVLAFEPVASERDGKPHKIEVRLRNRTRLTIRARESFVVQKDQPASTPAVPASRPPARTIANQANR